MGTNGGQETTFTTLPVFPGLLDPISKLIGVPPDALRLFASILLGFPVAFIYRQFVYKKNATEKHLYLFTAGFAFGFWNYGWSTFHSVTAVAFTYFTFCIFGTGSSSVTVTFVFNMAYLLWGYYSTATDSYDIKWTMPQCVLTLRLIGLTFDLYDGKQLPSSLSQNQKVTALRERPTLLEVFSFCFFPGSYLIGPQFSMRRYLDYINGNLILNERDLNNHKPPNSMIIGLNRALIGIVYIIMFQLGTNFVSDQYLVSDEFNQIGFIKRCFYIGLWGRCNLYKYISCWLITEGVCIAFGLTYNGKDKDGKDQWNGCANVDLWTFENATEFNHYVQSFNINTNHWCAEYIYKRLKFLGSKVASQAFTLMFLAIWHGLHSGYYVCFFQEFIIMYFEKDIKPVLKNNKKIQSILQVSKISKVFVWLILKIYTFVFMGYSLIPFVLLSYSRYIKVFSSIYFCGHVIFGLYPFLAPCIKQILKHKLRQHIE